MTIKEQINIIAIQEQVLTLLIKMKVMESMMIEKKVFTADEYSNKLNEAVAVYKKEFDTVYEQLDKLTNAIKQYQAKAEDKEPSNKEDMQPKHI
jgi:uncharacterized coiled-coil protein SlyX